jgi:cytochrome oxidase Cu insertion factor (SCO1/SenC/PrrC family)
MNKWRIWILLAAVAIAGATVYFFASSLTAAQPYEGSELADPASDFQLTDQHGAQIKLSDFRDKVVVLTFMDTECRDTCPLTAYHFREAYQQLESNERDRVVFIGINVNVDAGGVDHIEEITEGWRLDEMPSWYFLTGSSDELKPVWQAYGIGVVHGAHDAQDGGLTHTPGTYIIDLYGQKRWYISIPMSADENAQFTLPLNELLVRHIREILSDV